uniref:Uncharacterized protein n=1 Tax=Anguilla anguilla TaxID=7936 RepID=A0A0E9W6J9_ANGAN
MGKRKLKNEVVCRCPFWRRRGCRPRWRQGYRGAHGRGRTAIPAKRINVSLNAATLHTKQTKERDTQRNGYKHYCVQLR